MPAYGRREGPRRPLVRHADHPRHLLPVLHQQKRGHRLDVEFVQDPVIERIDVDCDERYVGEGCAHVGELWMEPDARRAPRRADVDAESRRGRDERSQRRRVDRAGRRRLGGRDEVWTPTGRRCSALAVAARIAHVASEGSRRGRFPRVGRLGANHDRSDGGIPPRGAHARSVNAYFRLSAVSD